MPTVPYEILLLQQQLNNLISAIYSNVDSGDASGTTTPTFDVDCGNANGASVLNFDIDCGTSQ